MTDKQPEAPRLADEWQRKTQREADRQNSAYDRYGTGNTPETVDPLGSKMAAELRRLHAENETLTLYKSLADEYGLSIFKDLKDLGDAGSDVQLLRTGYAAARLEIESLRKEHADELAVAYMCGASREKELAAQQSGAAYAALPECSAFLLCKGSDVTARAWNVDQMRAFADATCALRAAHGQAPARAAPAAVAGPSEFPHEKMDAVALGRYKVVSSDQSMFYRFAVVAGDGTQQLYIGREVDCQNMARKFAGAFLDGAFAYHSMTVAPTTQSSPAARRDALDAARYRWLRKNWFTMSSNYQHSITFKLGEPRWSDITEAELDAAIDVARAAQEGK